MFKKIFSILTLLALVFSLAACGGSTGLFPGTVDTTVTVKQTEAQTNDGSTAEASETQEAGSSGGGQASASVPAGGGALGAEDQFTDRDLEQTADLTGAEQLTLSDGKDIEITAAGVYVITGSASDATVIVDALDDDKVQIVLDGVTIENQDFPCIYIKNADKVFVTTTDSVNSLSVTGTFTADGETNTDAAVFSKDDLVINGTGTLNIVSSDNGITSKDDLRITGGTITVSCTADALEANDSIRIAGGDITVTTQKDGLHAENDDDNTLGYIYICGGSLNVTAGDDGIHGTTIVQIDGGSLQIAAAEGIEATWVQINGGIIGIKAADDGINAGKKSTICTPVIEINDGSITIVMGQGDTDGIDSNGNLTINGGTVDISAQSPFDYDGQAQYNGGTIIVNGTVTDSISNQFMGGGGMGGKGNMGGHGHGWGK